MLVGDLDGCFRLALDALGGSESDAYFLERCPTKRVQLLKRETQAAWLAAHSTLALTPASLRPVVVGGRRRHAEEPLAPLQAEEAASVAAIWKEELEDTIDGIEGRAHNTARARYAEAALEPALELARDTLAAVLRGAPPVRAADACFAFAVIGWAWQPWQRNEAPELTDIRGHIRDNYVGVRTPEAAPPPVSPGWVPEVTAALDRRAILVAAHARSAAIRAGAPYPARPHLEDGSDPRGRVSRWLDSGAFPSLAAVRAAIAAGRCAHGTAAAPSVLIPGVPELAFGSVHGGAEFLPGWAYGEEEHALLGAMYAAGFARDAVRACGEALLERGAAFTGRPNFPLAHPQWWSSPGLQLMRACLDVATHCMCPTAGTGEDVETILSYGWRDIGGWQP